MSVVCSSSVLVRTSEILVCVYPDSYRCCCFEPPAKLKSVRELLCVSGLELQRLTGLSLSDIQQLLTAAATACRQHPPVPGHTSMMSSDWTSLSHVTVCINPCVCVHAAILLHRGECRRLESGLRLGVGCPVLDELLRGGLPVGGVTELSGESGAGKTQLALQLCLSVQYPTQHGGLDSGNTVIHQMTLRCSEGLKRPT